MPDAPPWPPGPTGGGNASRAWAAQRAGGRRVFPPRPPPPPPPSRRPPPHRAADNGRRGEGGGGGAAARGNAGEEARYARRGGGVADREVEVGARADPAGAGRNAAAAAAKGGEALAPPSREEGRGGGPGGGGGGVGSKRPSAPPAQHLPPPPKRRAVSATTRDFPPPASRRTAAAPAPAPLAGAGSRTRYNGERENMDSDAPAQQHPPPKRRAVIASRELPPASRRTAAAPAPAPLAGADADAGSRARHEGDRENRGSGALEEKTAVAARPLAARKNGVGVLSRAVPPNAAGSRALNKQDGAAPMANTGGHGPKARMVKTSAAQGRGRGAEKLPVTATRLPPKPETISATRTSQLGRGRDGGFGSKVHRPLGTGRADGGLVVPEEMLAVDDDSSLADGRGVQIGVAKDAKVMNKYGGSSCRYNTAATSFAKDSSKTTLVGKIEFESGRMNRRASSNVAAGISDEGNVLRSKDMFTNQNTAKPANVAQKSVLDTQHIPFSRGKETVRGRQVTTNGMQDSVELSKDRVMQAHQQRKIASTSVSGSKGKLDDEGPSDLKFHDIFRDISFRRGKLELYLNTSSGLPSVRCQRQYRHRNIDARSKFKMLCRMFEFVCRTLVQFMEQRSLKMRIDFLAADVMKRLPYFSKPDPVVGQVPGVEVGDEFLYRSQLAIAGLHSRFRAGIATTYRYGMLIAISIVASGRYPDELGCSGELIYTGSGGKLAGNKKDEDQRLKGGNLALKNCIKAKTPVRVIHGFKCQNTEKGSHLGAKLLSRYIYDGLYSVVKFWMEGQPGARMFKYKLKRMEGQPELPMHIAKRLKTCKRRPGLCMNDISQGKEAAPISVINTVNDVRPAPFQYSTRIRYPFRPTGKHQGCDCTNGCSDSVSCACAVKNGGEIPFDLNGAILNEKPVIFECGPSCKCPPSCHNRVSQHGMKIPLEVFRTDKTGWGVRSLRSIPSGSFICEYIGELLHQKEADKRRNNSYLFDVGVNYDENVSSGLLSNASGLNSSSSYSQTREDVHFTLDASEYGNIGRFINHSCSPNLQAQNVLWDHDDKRMPHIMFFAAETIPPLQELTYDYNDSEIDRFKGVNRRIKYKACQCGSSQCRGRFY